MEINRCFGCMENITEYPCPQCGYDPENTRTSDYALHPGAILKGKYLLGRTLGQGGFGITYVGWDLALERKVAIKEYFPAGQVSRYPGKTELQWYTSERSRDARQTGMEMFLKEARKMSRVDTIAEIVGVQDLFQENETAYIVMDFIEGETLKARLQRTGPLNWEEAKLIFLPVAEAMEKVHQAGLIHRDISPDNLMLTPEGGVKILDLGAAKDLNLNSGASSMQVAKGGFSPLEQYTQRGGSGEWTDVYALAATMYYSLTGVLPPAAVDRVEEDNLRWNLPQLQALPKNVTAALKNAMILRAKERTQTMREFSDQLQGRLKKQKRSRKGTTAPASGRTPEEKKAGRKRLALVVAAAVTVVVIACGAVGLLQLSRNYNSACAAMQSGDYEAAYRTFTRLGTYKASAEKAAEAGLLQASRLTAQGAYQDAVTLLESIPQSEATEKAKNEACYAWASVLVSDKAYLEALQKLELLTEQTEQTEELAKKAHYGFATGQEGSHEERYSHLLAAGDFPYSAYMLEQIKAAWIRQILKENDESEASRFRSMVELNESDRDMLFRLVGRSQFYTSDDTSTLYALSARRVRQILLKDITGLSQQQENLRKAIDLLDPYDTSKFGYEHWDLVVSLWDYTMVRDIALTGENIFNMLLGYWCCETSEYMEFTSNNYGTTSFTTDLQLTPEPAGTKYYDIKRSGTTTYKLTLYWCNDSENLAEVFYLWLTGPNTMRVYSCAEEKYYMMERK